jgi:hypothetical protein
LEKDVVGQMMARGEPVDSQALESYHDTVEHEEQKRKQEELRLQQEREKQEEQDRLAKLQEEENKKKEEAEAAAKMQETKVEQAQTPPEQTQEIKPAEPESKTEVTQPVAAQAEPVSPLQVDDSQIPEIPPERLASRPRIVATKQEAQSTSGKEPEPAVSDSPQMHAHRQKPTVPAQSLEKPRIVSVVDYGVVSNGRPKPTANPAEQKLQDIARDLKPVKAGPGTPFAQRPVPAAPSSKPLSKEEAAELAVKIYEDKKRRQSIIYKLESFLGLHKNEPAEESAEGFTG